MKRNHLIAEYNISTHILTKRMTNRYRLDVGLYRYFNSHPHEEDDKNIIPYAVNNDISTHILTKRMTVTFLTIVFTT